jgi:hypothetical protein
MDKCAREGELLGKRSNRKLNLLIGFTGSVATIKDSALIKRFMESGLFHVKAIYTKSALHFRSQE